jgi:hypothetical protein
MTTNAGFWTKIGLKRHKKALNEKSSEAKYVYKTTREDYKFFQIFEA